MKTHHARTVARATLLCVAAMHMAGCGGGGESTDAKPAAATTPPTATPAPAAPPPAPVDVEPPTISGTPSTRAEVGRTYRFQPNAADTGGGTMAFRAQNQPRWLALDTVSGVLSGSPRSADIGVYKDIVLSVTDGRNTTSLAPFTVEVLATVTRPASGTPVAIPGIIEAERFDTGGQSVGYYDVSPANTGGQFRTNEAVDIRTSAALSSGDYAVTDFETTEWLAYTFSVTTAGTYELSLRASSAYGNSAYHVEIDGRDVSGQVAVPNTGDWDAFQWVGATTVSLTAGEHLLKVNSDHEFFDLDAIRIAVSTAQAAPLLPPPPDTAGVMFTCSFNAVPDCGLEEQSKVPGRASITLTSRDSGTALRLHTEPGDSDVVYSGVMERDDVWLSQYASDGYQGHEAWWAHSILFPDDFTVPTWQSYVVLDFHNSDPGPGQANFHVEFQPQADVTRPGLLTLVGFGGDTVNNQPVNQYRATVGLVQKNVWYDFVYHVRWSSGSDGFFDAWVNGKRVLEHRGPTLYTGQGVYLKLANYHLPVCDPYPSCIGSHKASSVIHDRVIRGATAAAVTSGPLEGFLDLVDGVLTEVAP